MPTVLAASADFASPLFWAVLIGWILSVVIHEFAHGLIAHFGGDYTIRERGGLSLNPLQYVHPITSIVMPGVFLMMGGVPLPGGATYIRRDLLRSRLWDSAVSAAGPISNLLIFLALAAAIHPKMGWVDYTIPAADWTAGQRVVATLAFLELLSVFLNLLPIPPLDGFGILCPYLDRSTQEKLTTPGSFLVGLIVVFMLFRIDRFAEAFYSLIFRTFKLLGFDTWEIGNIARAFNNTLFGG